MSTPDDDAVVEHIPAYEREPYRRELATEVLESGEAGGRPWAALRDTILYPEGGGQPADHGTVGAALVVDVQRTGDGVRHLLDRPLPPGPTRVLLDWPRRFDHMQQHTAQHLLTAVADRRFGWRTTAFHLGPEQSDVELDVAALTADDLRALEETVADAVRAARPVRARRVAAEDLEALAVRTRGLPAGHRGSVRLVEIEGLDRNTCGGTHVASTAELEAVCLLGTEPMRGGTRLFFVAGGRARARMAAHEARTAELRALLGAPAEELAAVAAAKLEQLTHAQRRMRALEDDLAAAVAADLAAAPEAILARDLPLLPAARLQQVARRVLEAAPHKAVLLTTGAGESGAFVLAAGSTSGIDAGALGPRVAEVLGGRGGGRGELYQGRAAHPQRRDDALVLVRGARAG